LILGSKELLLSIAAPMARIPFSKSQPTLYVGWDEVRIPAIGATLTNLGFSSI